MAVARMKTPPRVLVSASAIGYYGSRGDELLDEASTSGTGFLAEVARQWEAATMPATKAGVRVVHARIGVVLAKHGGALPKMHPAFRLGLGGVLGNGRQWWSWISLQGRGERDSEPYQQSQRERASQSRQPESGHQPRLYESHGESLAASRPVSSARRSGEVFLRRDGSGDAARQSTRFSQSAWKRWVFVFSFPTSTRPCAQS